MRSGPAERPRTGFAWLAPLAALAGGLFCAGCASDAERPQRRGPVEFQIEGVEIRNELPYPVTNVQVLVPATGGFVSCGNVPSDATCSASFPLRDYRGDAIRVTWEEHGVPQKEDDFVLKAPSGLEPVSPAWIQVVLFAPGDAGARVLADRPTQP